MTHVRQSVVGVVILAIASYMTLRMQKSVLRLVNIEGHNTCMHFKRACDMLFLTKFDQYISGMTAVTVLKCKHCLRSSFLII